MTSWDRTWILLCAAMAGAIGSGRDPFIILGIILVIILSGIAIWERIVLLGKGTK